jgi:hypothetical protein
MAQERSTSIPGTDLIKIVDELSSADILGSSLPGSELSLGQGLGIGALSSLGYDLLSEDLGLPVNKATGITKGIGATLGTALLPGIGTVLGTLGGGLLSGIVDDDPRKAEFAFQLGGNTPEWKQGGPNSWIQEKADMARYTGPGAEAWQGKDAVEESIREALASGKYNPMTAEGGINLFSAGTDPKKFNEAYAQQWQEEGAIHPDIDPGDFLEKEQAKQLDQAMQQYLSQIAGQLETEYGVPIEEIIAEEGSWQMDPIRAGADDLENPQEIFRQVGENLGSWYGSATGQDVDLETLLQAAVEQEMQGSLPSGLRGSFHMTGEKRLPSGLIGD